MDAPLTPQFTYSLFKRMCFTWPEVGTNLAADADSIPHAIKRNLTLNTPSTRTRFCPSHPPPRRRCLRTAAGTHAARHFKMMARMCACCMLRSAACNALLTARVHVSWCVSS
jgi:hypothetical protein